MPFKEEHVKLHQFVHTIEHDVLIPLFSSGTLNSYTRIEELSTAYKKPCGYKHTVIGLSITSRCLFGVDYFGHLKKSLGLFESPQKTSKVPVICYQKIPENIIRTHLKDKNTAVNLKNRNRQLQDFIQGKNHDTKQEDSLGEETNFRRERRIFESMFEAGD